MAASVTGPKQKPQLASFVLDAHMVMFNSAASYQRVKELFMSCERVSATIVCMCELVLLSQFHGLFINTFPLGCLQQCGWMREGLLQCVFVQTFFFF